MPTSFPLVEFGTTGTGYYDPGQLPCAGSQDTDLSCDVSISTFCCTMWSRYETQIYGEIGSFTLLVLYHVTNIFSAICYGLVCGVHLSHPVLCQNGWMHQTGCRRSHILQLPARKWLMFYHNVSQPSLKGSPRNLHTSLVWGQAWNPFQNIFPHP